jgi:hypothetical protein
MTILPILANEKWGTSIYVLLISKVKNFWWNQKYVLANQKQWTEFGNKKKANSHFAKKINMSWIVNCKRTMHYFIYLYTIHNKMYFILWNKINVRNLTLEYLSGKFIHKNSPLSEQFQNQISKWKKRQNRYP